MENFFFFRLSLHRKLFNYSTHNYAWLMSTANFGCIEIDISNVHIGQSGYHTMPDFHIGRKFEVICTVKVIAQTFTSADDV